MRSVEELTDFIIEALNDAIDRGFMLIRGEWGVKWNEEQGEWAWDPEWCRIPGCDLVGAVLLRQPPIDRALHQGDPDRAMRLIVSPDFYSIDIETTLEMLFESKAYQFVRNLVNGWDGESYAGDDEPSYELGAELGRIYRPMDIEVINLSSITAQSEVRLRVTTEAESNLEMDSLVG